MSIDFGKSLGTPGFYSRKIMMSAPVFDSFQRRHVTGGVTVDYLSVPLNAESRRVLYAGEILGKVTATGLYALWDDAATDGREIPRGIVEATNDVTNGNSFVGIGDEARVHVARMPRQFTAAQWEKLSNGLYVKITPAEPYEVPGPTVISVALAPAGPLALSVGDTVQISAVFNPTDTVNQDGTWVSSNPSIATVDAEGNVTGIAAGTANITFATQVGGITTAPVAVTVS